MGVFEFLTPASGEKFLVVEVLPKSSRGFYVELLPDKVFKLRKEVRDFNLNKLLEKPDKFYRRQTVILNFCSSLAFEAKIAVEVIRENPGAVLSEPELENVLVEAVQKNFSCCREAADKNLDAGDEGVALADVRAADVKLDGSSVTGLASQHPRKLNANLEMVFVRRDMLDLLTTMTDMSHEALWFTEDVASRIFVLRKTGIERAVNFLADGGDGQCLFVAEQKNGCEIIRRHALNWNSDWPAQIIASTWSLRPETGAQFYRKYLRKEIAPTVDRRIKSLFRPAECWLDEQIRGKIGRGPLCVGTAAPLLLPATKYDLRDGRELLAAAMRKFGFATEPSWALDEISTFRVIAPILKFYYDNNRGLGGKLRRRLRWLNARSVR